MDDLRFTEAVQEEPILLLGISYWYLETRQLRLSVKLGAAWVFSLSCAVSGSRHRNRTGLHLDPFLMLFAHLVEGGRGGRRTSENGI